MGTSRVGFVLSGMCALVLALGPSVARAQEEEAPPYPPPQYQYQPPPYQYPPLTRDQARMMKPPPKGTAAIVTGFVLLPIGLMLAGASIPVWTLSCDRGCNPQVAAVGMILDVVGGGFLIASLVLIPIGFVRRAHYRDWLRSHGYSLSAAPGGLQLRF